MRAFLDTRDFLVEREVEPRRRLPLPEVLMNSPPPPGWTLEDDILDEAYDVGVMYKGFDREPQRDG